MAVVVAAFVVVSGVVAGAGAVAEAVAGAVVDKMKHLVLVVYELVLVCIELEQVFLNYLVWVPMLFVWFVDCNKMVSQSDQQINSNQEVAVLRNEFKKEINYMKLAS